MYKKIILFVFLAISATAHTNEFEQILRQLVVSKISKQAPEVGRVLQSLSPNRPKVWIAPNTSINIGHENYSNPFGSTQTYPEPKTARDYIVYGKLLGNSGKIQDAAQYFLIARNMEPDNPEARYGLAMALTMMGQKEEAKEECEALQRLTEQLIMKTNKITQLLGK